MPTNPTSHANVSAGASGGSGNPWQPPQRQPASQRAGPVGQRPNCNDFQPSVRPINTGWGGSCSNNNSSRRVTSAPLQQPPVGPNVPSRRVFFPDPRPPRPNAFARDQAREQQNLEARRAVAVNTWQAFMRDRILTLGYFVAGDVWLRSNTFQAGRFSQQETEEQEDYARWCWDTILGFER